MLCCARQGMAVTQNARIGKTCKYRFIEGLVRSEDGAEARLA